METPFPDREQALLSARQLRAIDFRHQPAIAVVWAISGVLMEILGPMFWAALIVLFIQAELFTD